VRGPSFWRRDIHERRVERERVGVPKRVRESRCLPSGAHSPESRFTLFTLLLREAESERASEVSAEEREASH